MSSRISPVRIPLFKTVEGTAGKDLHPNRLGCTPGPLGLNRSRPVIDGKDSPPESGPETGSDPEASAHPERNRDETG